MTPPTPTRSAWLPSLHIARPLLLCTAAATLYTLGVWAFAAWHALPNWEIGNEAAAFLAFALGLLLVLRTNAANGRWWEARKLWGQLINECRNLRLKAAAHAHAGPGEQREFARLLAAFPHALRRHLRGDPPAPVPGFEETPTAFPHLPGYIAGLIHHTLDRWNRERKLADTVWLLDVHARALMDVCGGCERIRNTPLASSYRALLRWSILLYIAFSPWSVCMEVMPWLPALLVAFAFLIGMELVAEAVEEPFGGDGDDLPLADYCRTIETFVLADLDLSPAGQPNPPPVAAPQ